MVYLLHKAPPVWGTIKRVLLYLYSSNELAVFVALAIVMFVVIFAACIIADKIRLRLTAVAIGFCSRLRRSA